MAKSQATTTLSPFAFVRGKRIKGKDMAGGVEVVSNLSNWAGGKRKTVHFSGIVAPDDYDSEAKAVGAIGRMASSTQKRFFVTSGLVSEEAAQNDFTLSAQCFCEVGTTITITFELTGPGGTETDTIACTSTENGDEVTGAADLATAMGSAAGKWTMAVSVQVTAGSGTVSYPIVISWEEAEVATLSDPAE